MAALALTIFAAAPALANDLVGRASVLDGDTLEIHGNRIRLFGIDAPESAQTCQEADGRLYRCGQAAANALANFIGTKTIRCEPRDVDPYGRTVALCRAGNVDVAGWLVRAGLAIEYTRYSNGAYGPAQRAADINDVGMWRGPFVEPWLYRACIRNGGRPAGCSAAATSR